MTAVYPSLRGRSVLITGGASGIGEALVRAFAGQQSRVAFIDILQKKGRELAAETGAAFYVCDLRDIDQLRETVLSAAADVGEFMVLVNNAANDERHKWEDVSVQQWDERLAVNVRHVFFAIQTVAPMMIRAGGGSIINFGSSSWMLGQGGMPGYTTSKAGIHGMTRSFACDLGKNRIRVNTVVPGWVMTQRQLDNWMTPEKKKKLEQDMCLADMAMPEDVAAMTLWLAADDSRMCTSQNFIVDGGWI